MTRPAVPPQFGPLYRTLAEIAREQRKAKRDHLRSIIEQANEIECEAPPPPPWKPGVELLGGHAWIDETGAVQ